MGARKEGCICQWGCPKSYVTAAPDYSSLGYHICPVTLLPSILYSSSCALLLHEVLLLPFVCLKTTLSSGLQTPERGHKAFQPSPGSNLPSHVISVLCSQWPLPSTTPAMYSIMFVQQMLTHHPSPHLLYLPYFCASQGFVHSSPFLCRE